MPAATQEWQDELHRPFFPYKYKFKFAGCPNDCVASIARSDCSVIGVWRDDIKVDQAKVAEYAKTVDINSEICDVCPTRCIDWDGKTLEIDNANCVKCMHCINVMPKAVKPGDDRGATILIGGKAPIVGGALLCSVFVPFLEMDPARGLRGSQGAHRGHLGALGVSTARPVSAQASSSSASASPTFSRRSASTPSPRW